MVFVNTGDVSYWQPLRPRVTIKSQDGSDTYFTFNAFNTPSNPITITELSVDNAVGETGGFSMNINDNTNTLDESKLRGAKVFIEFGKTPTSFQTFLIGFADQFGTDRSVTAFQSYDISGPGTQIQARELMLHRRQTLDEDETDARIHRMAENALTKRLWRPLKRRDVSIQDYTGWDEAGIDSRVNIPYRVVNIPLTYFASFMDTLCEASGAVWFVDVSDGTEVFRLTYSTSLHTGVQIKSGDLKNLVADDATRTSYIVGGWGVNDESTTEAGVATRLYTTQILDKEQIFAITGQDGSTNTTYKAIAQQAVIDNDARRIDSIELILSKKGDPSSPEDRLNGDICLDVNNKPTGTILDEFHIDLGSIRESSKTITVEDIDVSQSKLSAGQTKIWVRIFQRSNEETTPEGGGDPEPDGNGDPNHGTKHTILVYHNNKFNTTQPYYSATAPVGDAKDKKSLVWNSTNQGPMYNVDINSNIRRLYSRTNKRASHTLRMREQFVDTSFMKDIKSVGRFLSLNLSQTSKARRSLDIKVRVPNDYLFRPYQMVTFSDGLSGISEDLQVKRVNYTCGSSGGDTPIGTLYANLTLGGLYNTLTANCNCT